jgi:hypothetical protein
MLAVIEMPFQRSLASSAQTIISHIENEGTLEMITAEYTNATSKISAMLFITKIVNGRRELVDSYSVSGKREARQIADQLNAKPWNF